MRTTHKQKYHRYLKSKKWKAIRMKIINERENCERCWGENRLEIHHKTYKNVFNEKMEDLELLCHSCHQQHHGFEKAEKPSFLNRLTTFLFG